MCAILQIGQFAPCPVTRRVPWFYAGIARNHEMREVAQTREPDRAVTAIQKLLSIPQVGALVLDSAPLTPALLRLDPMFDPLRNDPRLQKLVASESPK
jgi:hypothetical protein